jgi:prophage antirepressor-like protein
MSAVYEEIKDSHEVIQSVAKNINPLFSILKTYGTRKFPMCAATDVAKLLEIKSVDSMLKGFTSRELVIAKVKELDSDNRPVEKPCKFLTKHGIYRVLFNSHTPLGEVVREFIYMVLDKLEEDGVVHLEHVQKDMNIQFADEIRKATEFLRERVQCLETEIMASGRILRRNTDLMHMKEAENNKLSQERQNLKMKILNLEQQLMQAALDETRRETTDESLLEYLKTKYMTTKVFVYLLPSRDDTDYNYDYKDYDISNPPDDSDTMYYRLSRNNDLKVGRLIYESCFEFEFQFNDLKIKLNKTCTPDAKINDVVLCELSLITEYIEDIRNAPIIAKKKEKRAEIENTLANLRNMFNMDFA